MDLVYLSQRRPRRLWPVVGLLAVVGLTVTVQVTMAAVGPAHGAPSSSGHAGPVVGRAVARAPATAPATVFIAGLDNGD